LVVAAAAALGATWMVVPATSGASTAHDGVPHYSHIIEIMMENTNFSTIINNPLAPQINALAANYGLATDYFGVTHPSEPNYVANVGGSYFGIQDDNQFYCTPALASTDPTCSGTTVDHTVHAPNLATQLREQGLTWRGYFQSLPPVPATGLVKTGPGANGPYSYKWPSNANALYASKHNPFVNFAGTQNSLRRMVPDTRLSSDLADGRLANYSLIVPNQCNDMHGTGSCPNASGLIAAGDAYVASTVAEIMASPTWAEGRNAIVITWDEDDFGDSGQPGTGCCGSDVGGGRVATIVITNHSTGPVTDSTPYNHYSLLRTIEDAFGLSHLAHAGDASVPAMTKLFAP
jgi:phospholipase C